MKYIKNRKLFPFITIVHSFFLRHILTDVFVVAIGRHCREVQSGMPGAAESYARDIRIQGQLLFAVAFDHGEDG